MNSEDALAAREAEVYKRDLIRKVEELREISAVEELIDSARYILESLSFEKRKEAVKDLV